MLDYQFILSDSYLQNVIYLFLVHVCTGDVEVIDGEDVEEEIIEGEDADGDGELGEEEQPRGKDG